MPEPGKGQGHRDAAAAFPGEEQLQQRVLIQDGLRAVLCEHSEHRRHHPARWGRPGQCPAQRRHRRSPWPPSRTPSLATYRKRLCTEKHCISLQPAEPVRGRVKLLIGSSTVMAQMCPVWGSQTQQACQLTACKAALRMTEAQLTGTSMVVVLTLTARALTKVSIPQVSI